MKSAQVRRRYGAFTRPPGAQPVPQRVRGQAERGRHFNQTTAIRKLAASRVRVLLRSSGPATIVWAVAAIIVDAINTQAIKVAAVSRPLGEEFKTGRPFVANRDSSAAVQRPADRFRVGAPRLHARPDSEQARPTLAMRLLALRSNVVLQATTGKRCATAQLVTHDDFLGAALATAKPCDVSLAVASPRNNGVSAEFLAGEVDGGASWHWRILAQKRRGGWA